MVSERLITIFIFLFASFNGLILNHDKNQMLINTSTPRVSHTFSEKYLHWHVRAYIKMQQFTDCSHVLKIKSESHCLINMTVKM